MQSNQSNSFPQHDSSHPAETYPFLALLLENQHYLLEGPIGC